MSFFKVSLIAISLAYLGLGLMAFFLTPRLLYPIPPAGYGEGPEITFLVRPGGHRLATTYFPVENARRVVLYHHGNAEDLSNVRERLAAFQERGYAAFAYDYPGYGLSEGHPSERTLLAAAETAYTHLTEALGWAPEHIIHYGHSLGGGPAIAMGARHPSGGVVVEGTFSSVFRVMTHVRLLPWDVFDNLRRVRDLQAPLLVLHGTDDSTIPLRHAAALVAAADEAEYVWVEGAHHVNLWDVADEAFWKRFAGFVGESTAPAPK